jgi:hypothetical protein
MFTTFSLPLPKWTFASDSSAFLVINRHDQRRLLLDAVELLYILPAQFEVIHVSILRDAPRIVTFRERDPVLLETVPYQDLCCSLPVLLSNRRECRVIRLLVADQRTVRLHDDVVLVTIFHNLTLLEPWMKLCERCQHGTTRLLESRSISCNILQAD